MRPIPADDAGSGWWMLGVGGLVTDSAPCGEQSALPLPAPTCRAIVVFASLLSIDPTTVRSDENSVANTTISPPDAELLSDHTPGGRGSVYKRPCGGARSVGRITVDPAPIAVPTVEWSHVSHQPL